MCVLSAERTSLYVGLGVPGLGSGICVTVAKGTVWPGWVISMMVCVVSRMGRFDPEDVEAVSPTGMVRVVGTKCRL